MTGIKGYHCYAVEICLSPLFGTRPCDNNVLTHQNMSLHGLPFVFPYSYLLQSSNTKDNEVCFMWLLI